MDYYRKANKPLPEFQKEIEREEHLLLECLTPMMNSLKAEEKEMLELTQLQQYSLREVAEKKNIALNTAKSQLFRAKKALASKFFSCCTYERNAKGEIVDFLNCEGKCSK